MTDRELDMLFGGSRPGTGLTSQVVPLLVVLALVVLMLAFAALIVALERRIARAEIEKPRYAIRLAPTGGFPVILSGEGAGGSPTAVHGGSRVSDGGGCSPPGGV